jgi:hypothetical protein
MRKLTLADAVAALQRARASAAGDRLPRDTCMPVRHFHAHKTFDLSDYRKHLLRARK